MLKRHCHPMMPQPCMPQVVPPMMMPPVVMPAVVEPTNHKFVEKCFNYEVPHICPVHTHVTNKHIYNHTYTPAYSASEDNQMINNNLGSCCNY